jgi:hypothetical protein
MHCFAAFCTLSAFELHVSLQKLKTVVYGKKNIFDHVYCQESKKA